MANRDPVQGKQSSDFIGRRTELREITNLIRHTKCRLLTLVGVGGVGKTCLALRAFAELQAEFDDGAYVVGLQASRSMEDMVAAVAQAMGLALSGHQTPAEQLLHFLQHKDLLILLDNFEQLIDMGTFLSHLLHHAPNLKLLVTSREALNLHEEHRYIVKGLQIPESHHVQELLTCESVQLFVERAQRVRKDFVLEAERAGVVRICQLVEGMPLAIEIAASWVKVLRCATIAAEIQQNLDFLQSNLRNVQERHQSMQAVFAQTWDRLTEAEQTQFTKLSIFQGGFQREAAEVITGASLHLLSSLLDKCLIRRDPEGRYRLHELLRQYAEARLVDTPKVAESHCRYFADFLATRKHGLVENAQLETSMEIEHDVENIRVAWRYGIMQQDVNVIRKMAASYFYYCQIRSHFLENANASEQAVIMLDKMDQPQLVAQIQVYWGWMLIRIGRFNKAEEVLSASLAQFEYLDLRPAYGMGSHPLSAFAVLKGIQGNYTQAIDMGEQLKRSSQRDLDLHNLSFACYALTSAYLSAGQYEEAQHNAQQAVEVAEAVGNVWFKAYCLIEWGKVAYAMNQYDEAQSHFRASLRIRENFDDPEGIAVLSTHLGKVALAQQEYDTASHLFGRSLSVYQDLNDHGGLAGAHQGLGKVAIETNQLKEAAAHLHDALRIASHIQFFPLILSILLDVAELLLGANQHQLAIDVLQVTAAHPASNAQHQQRIEALWANHLLPDRQATYDLQTLLSILQTELEDWPTKVSDEQPLVDPLTPRELEILQKIATGMSNTEIAEELIISDGTVKAHTSSIYGKLGVSNRTEAVAKSRDIGILS